MKIFCVVFLTFWGTSLVASSGSNARFVIECARSVVGSETALKNLVTLKISGRINSGESKLSSASISITARKPCSQRLELNVDDLLETTILEGNQGCIIRLNQSDSDTGSQVRMMADEEIERVAFNTRQLFSFYEVNSRNGEVVTYDGIEQRRGIRCHKLLYSYPNGISVTRYFAVNGCTLVSMITDKGVESVEIGKWVIDGIQFPKRIEYYHGNKRLHTLVLDKIEVNKPLRPGIFTIPKVRKTN